MKASILRVRVPVYQTRWVYDDNMGWCIELYSPRPAWRSVLEWTLTIAFVAALVAAQLVLAGL